MRELFEKSSVQAILAFVSIGGVTAGFFTDRITSSEYLPLAGLCLGVFVGKKLAGA